MPAKTKPRKRTATPASVAGTYVFDQALGRVVRVSDRIPKVASKGGPSAPDVGPCGRAQCAGGRCAGPRLASR